MAYKPTLPPEHPQMSDSPNGPLAGPLVPREAVAPVAAVASSTPPIRQVERRAAVFRAQVEAYWRRLGEEWAAAKHLPIPPLSLPGVVATSGACELCGEPLMAGRTFRCTPCVEAITLMLARLTAGP